MSAEVESGDRLVYAAGEPEHGYVHGYEALTAVEDDPLWLIGAERLGAIIDDAYAAASQHPERPQNRERRRNGPADL